MTAPLLDRASFLPEEVVPPFVALLVALADNKHALGLRYGEWCSSGPTIEAGVAATAMAQDELGHARVLYGLLEELPGSPRRSEHEWSAADARTIAMLERPFPDWLHLIVANVLFDHALAQMLEAGLDSRYLPLRQRARKLIEEERYHAIHGRGWLVQLAGERSEVRARLQDVIGQMWADTLCWFGPDDGGTLARLVEIGVLRDAGAAVRRRFLKSVGPVLRDAGLDGGRLSLGEPLPWSRWDEASRRIRRD